MRNNSYKDESGTPSKSKKPSKSKRGKFNSKKDGMPTPARLDSKDRPNDPNYYFTNAELANQAAQLSFQNMIGLGSVNGYKMPSIAKITMYPTPGMSYQGNGTLGGDGYYDVTVPAQVSDDKHGINLMSSKLYTMLSTFTGRTSQYGPQDVALMLLAQASIAELSEYIRRMFGIALTYNPRNRNLPLGLLRTMLGGDTAAGGSAVKDFLAKIPDYRMRFNVAMTRINQIPLLDNIGYIRKSREMYQKIFMDSPSPMAQIFYYAPRSVWQLEESLQDTGSVLKPIGINGYNMDGLLTVLESMITHVLESSTLNLVYADLLNMANKIKVPVWQFDYLAENYIVMPEYNRTASLQFHHITPIRYPVFWIPEGDENFVTNKTIHLHHGTGTAQTAYEMTFTNGNYVISDPNKNNIVYNPVFFQTTYPEAVIDCDTGNPSLEDRIEALRMTVVPGPYKMKYSELAGTSSELYTILPALPDHFCDQISIYDNIDYAGAVSYRAYSRCVYDRPSSSAAENFMLQIRPALDKFDKAPFTYWLDSSYSQIETLFGDVDFYTTVDYKYLRRVNELMFTGLFDFRSGV